MSNSIYNSDANTQNTSKIVEFIYRNQDVSRIKLAHALNIKPATVTNIIASLIKEQLVFETGDQIRELKGSGRSRKLLSINPQYAFFIGIEFNMTGIMIAATNSIGNCLYQNSIKTSEYSTNQINHVIIRLIQGCINHLGSQTCSGIGIAIPGHFDSLHQTVISNNKIWEHFNLNEIKNVFSIPIFIQNNIECMALEEYLFDPHNSPDKFLFIHVGPGLFCSFFDSLHITLPKGNYIGEIGHTVVDRTGSFCECGKRGCLQTYISDSWLIETAKYLYEHSSNTVLRNLVSSTEEITLDTVIAAYTLGDSFIIDKIEIGLSLLAISIANTLIIYDSQKIFINSQLLNHLDFKEKLIKHIHEQFEFISTDDQLNIEVLAFDLYRGAQAACALAAYHTIIRT
ncbi:ROK family transcriptional regulator [Streptococcus marmotae]|uniref:ROK family transcriptional regulator n=1 Tax=Streptococcus marmotae TaxID=1825069 RepID=UPI0008361EF2|nr:ROK family transcriptional regulator [Streptococcus marmotae]